jgi:FtsH-binding integral membrane protein
MFQDNQPKSVHYAREVNVMYRIYAWMCAALAITAAVAYYVAITPSVFIFIHKNPISLIVLFLLQLGLVVAISSFINKLNLATAIGLFILYSISMGMMLSVVFMLYTLGSIFSTFIVTSVMFGAMAVYGYVTKTDLTSMGSILFMGLIGIILAGLINLWFKSPAFDFVISGIGVLIFTLLTAYDVQKLKNMVQELSADRETTSKIAIVGALTLYLDFINLFLFLLRLLGRQKEQ